MFGGVYSLSTSEQLPCTDSSASCLIGASHLDSSFVSEGCVATKRGMKGQDAQAGMRDSYVEGKHCKTASRLDLDADQCGLTIPLRATGTNVIFVRPKCAT